MFRSTSRRVALATEGTQESLSLSHFNRKIRLPRGPVNFFSWARKFSLSNQRCKGTTLPLRFTNVEEDKIVNYQLSIRIAVAMVKVKMVKIEKSTVKIRHYNINIYIYI